MIFKGFNPWDIATHNEKQLIVVLGTELSHLSQIVDAQSEEIKEIQKKLLQQNSTCD